jgi:RNA polymerase sigma factor (sigma-70 family)
MLESEVYKELRKLLYQAIEGLSEQRRKIILLHIQEDRTPAEIARILKISRKTVYDHLDEGTKLLRKLLKDKKLHIVMALMAGAIFLCFKKFAL